MLTKKTPEDMARLKEKADAWVKGFEAITREVWDALGAGHAEALYRDALLWGLLDRGIVAQAEVCVPVTFRGRIIGNGRADIAIHATGGRVVIVELKAVAKLNAAHRAQLRAYLNSAKVGVGFLVNYSDTEFEFEVVTP